MFFLIFFLKYIQNLWTNIFCLFSCLNIFRTYYEGIFSAYFLPQIYLELIMNGYFFLIFSLNIFRTIDNSRTGLDTSKNQCSAPAVTALKKLLTVSYLQFISTKELVKCIRLYNYYHWLSYWKHHTWPA